MLNHFKSFYFWQKLLLLWIQFRNHNFVNSHRIVKIQQTLTYPTMKFNQRLKGDVSKKYRFWTDIQIESPEVETAQKKCILKNPRELTTVVMNPLLCHYYKFGFFTTNYHVLLKCYVFITTTLLHHYYKLYFLLIPLLRIITIVMDSLRHHYYKSIFLLQITREKFQKELKKIKTTCR